MLDPENSPPENNLPDKLKLHFDGGADKNPGGVAVYGWFITDEHGKEISSGYGVASAYTALATNNFAEYCALGFGLRWLKEQKWKGQLEILGDSQLVIYQMIGRWKCNAEHLIKLRNRCLKYLEGITYTARWIPREQNSRCDELGHVAYREFTGKDHPKKK